jgi:hypothetical protein
MWAGISESNHAEFEVTPSFSLTRLALANNC